MSDSERCCKCGNFGVPLCEALDCIVCFPCFTKFMQEKGYIEKGDQIVSASGVYCDQIILDSTLQMQLPF